MQRVSDEAIQASIADPNICAGQRYLFVPAFEDLRDLRAAAREALKVIACCEICFMEKPIDKLRALAEGSDGRAS